MRSDMSDFVKSVQVYTLTKERDKPYLGETGPDEVANVNGYFVRKENRTVYPIFDRSVLVRLETNGGVVGWGETYGIVAPGAVCEIISDLLAEFTIGRDPTEPELIYQDLYDLMRVRGYTGGFYVDALAAIDIALWDIAGKIVGKSVTELLGGKVNTKICAYVSGLPEKFRSKRVELALKWQDMGFEAFKIARVATENDPTSELRELRSSLGKSAKIAIDLHWMDSPKHALHLIRSMQQYDLWFAEAPVQTEDFEGLQQVCKDSEVPIAVGEEWRTHWDLINRFNSCNISIIQPEMGHTGVTNFVRIAKLAKNFGLEIMPHATVGSGIFLAASLQASAAITSIKWHEFQHSIFEPNRGLWEGDMDCKNGFYIPSNGPGLNVQPSEEALGLLKQY